MRCGRNSSLRSAGFCERATDGDINELFDSVKALRAAMEAHDLQNYVKALALEEVEQNQAEVNLTLKL
jgi:hypothetical protein